MTEQDILGRLVPLVRQVTGARPEEITMGKYLMRDLGAESIDLLDRSFLIDEEFDVTLEPDEFESQARERLGGADYEREGYLTEASLAELRNALPEVDPELLRPPMKKIEVPTVLNVAVFVHLIQHKLATREREDQVA